MLSTAAGITTYRLVREPMLTVGSAIVSHHAAANCAAIHKVMAGLALTRLDSLVGGHPDGLDESDAVDALMSFGVLNLTTGGLEDLHLSRTDAPTVRHLLRQIPLTGSRPAFLSPSAAVQRTLDQHDCPEFNYALRPTAVRLYPLVMPAGSQGDRNAKSRDGFTSGQLIAFLHGPWRNGSGSKIAFALVDLAQLAERESDHPHGEGWDALIRHGQLLRDRVSLLPLSILSSPEALTTALPHLKSRDTPLSEARLVAFANRVLLLKMEIDQRRLTRSTRRAAAGVFLMGLLGTSVVVLISRASQQKLRRLNQLLKQESRTDRLTQTANRRAWDEALAQADLRRTHQGECFALIVVDLDDFKGINDRHGHQRGDQILQQTAGSLAECLRGTDLLARVGGDEFAILLEMPQAEGLQELMERLRSSLARADIQASIGGAMSRPDESLETTWNQADASMYEQKRP